MLSLHPAQPDQLPLIHQLTLNEPYFWHTDTSLLDWDHFCSGDIRWWTAKDEGGTVRAVVSLGHWDAFNRSAALGLIVLPESRRGTFGSQALAAATEMAFRRLGLHRLWASVRAENEVVWKGLEKRGWKCCGFFQDVQYDNGKWCHRRLYELLSKEGEVKEK